MTLSERVASIKGQSRGGTNELTLTGSDMLLNWHLMPVIVAPSIYKLSNRF